MKRIVIGLSLFLVGCSAAPTVVEKPILVERPALIVQDPQPAEQYDFEWIVITKDNAEAKFKELETKGVVVLFAVTPQGYQALAMGGAEVRRYIQQQQSVLAAYKAYYEKPKDPEPEKPKEQPKEDKPSWWKLW